MAKVTVNNNAETPSQQVVKAAQAEVEVFDARGRKIALRKPGALAQFHLVAAVGDNARNEVYMAMCLPLLYIARIDGEAVPPPRTQLQLDALITRLEEDGIEAVLPAVREHYGKTDPESDKAALKN